MESVKIHDGVTSIGEAAFSNCKDLNDISIPKGVSSIGRGAFTGCEKLESISIPDSVLSIGANAFNGTALFKNKDNWDNGILYVDNALIQADSFFHGPYEIKPGTQVIADEAFIDGIRGCHNLKSITIPGSVKHIGYRAFAKCEWLTSVTICEGVESVGFGAFSECTCLRSISISNSVKRIGEHLFFNCRSLSEISFGEWSDFYNRIVEECPPDVVIHTQTDPKELPSRRRRYALLGFVLENGQDYENSRAKAYLNYARKNSSKLLKFAVEHPELLQFMRGHHLLD